MKQKFLHFLSMKGNKRFICFPVIYSDLTTKNKTPKHTYNIGKKCESQLDCIKDPRFLACIVYTLHSNINKSGMTVYENNRNGQVGYQLKQKKIYLTCDVIEASFVESSHEQLKTNDGVDDDDKENKEGDVNEGNDCHEDGVHDDLKTWNTRNQTKRSQNSEGSQSFDIKPLDLQDGKNLTDHSEKESSLVKSRRD